MDIRSLNIVQLRSLHARHTPNDGVWNHLASDLLKCHVRGTIREGSIKEHIQMLDQMRFLESEGYAYILGRLDRLARMTLESHKSS